MFTVTIYSGVNVYSDYIYIVSRHLKCVVCLDKPACVQSSDQSVTLG